MVWVNYHAHTHYCDGRGIPEDFVKEAVRLKMLNIGFSGHAPLPFPTDWVILENELDEYINEIRQLKKEYSSKSIDISDRYSL